MARAGVYKTEVQNARDSLIAQRKHPSVDAVRVALGNTGSKAPSIAISKSWKLTRPRHHRPVPPSVTLQTLVAQLAARLQEEADVRIAEAQTRYDATVQKAADLLAAQEREGRALSDRLQRTETALQEETRLHQEAMGQLQERGAGLEARLADQDAHIQSLEQKHTQAREALEHFRQSSKEQRDAESLRHEQQVQMLQVELRQANDLVTTKNHETTQLNRDNARLTEVHGQTESTLRTLRRECEQVAKVAKEVPYLKWQNETLGQQRIQATNERAIPEPMRSDTRWNCRRNGRRASSRSTNRDVAKPVYKRLRNCLPSLSPKIQRWRHRRARARRPANLNWIFRFMGSQRSGPWEATIPEHVKPVLRADSRSWDASAAIWLRGGHPRGFSARFPWLNRDFSCDKFASYSICILNKGSASA